MRSPSYFEDFEIGVSEEFGEYTVTEEEILEFASKYDPQPFHLSEEAGKFMHFGGLCASGWHTCAIAMRMIVDHMPKANKGALGSPGIDELRWTKPVFPNRIGCAKHLCFFRRPKMKHWESSETRFPKVSNCTEISCKWPSKVYE